MSVSATKKYGVSEDSVQSFLNLQKNRKRMAGDPYNHHLKNLELLIHNGSKIPDSFLKYYSLMIDEGSATVNISEKLLNQTPGLISEAFVYNSIHLNRLTKVIVNEETLEILIRR